MIGEPLPASVLALRLIPDVHPELAAKLELSADQRCLAMITCDIDDSLYAALDQGTKAAEVQVVYARSFYAGSAHPSGPLSGEIIGMLAAADMDTLVEGVGATLRYLRDEALFFAADEAGELAYFPHVISATGTYLSAEAGVEPGSPLAYLIAPPLEATLGLDAALKAADVRLALYYPAPSETNFSGGLLAGDLPACRAAAAAFEAAVRDVAARPQHLDFPRSIAEVVGPPSEHARRLHGEGSFQLWGSGMAVQRKPEGYTHLFDNRSLVPKTHPVMKLRGTLDVLQAAVMQAQITARQHDRMDLCAELQQLLEFLRRLLAAEVRGGQQCPQLQLAGFTADELRSISHNTMGHLGVGFVLPDVSLGPLVVALNGLRAQSRQLELVATEAFAAPGCHLPRTFCDAAGHALNRLSSALHVLTAREIALARP